MQILIVVVAFLVSISAPARTLFISDIDDTIKLAHIQDISEAARYAFDEESRFAGMSELYNLVVKDNAELSVVYLSKAPEWFMKNTHTTFLKNGAFPPGYYVGRTSYDADEHKVRTLRKLLNQFKPDTVILIGDNGEQDSNVYHQIAKEFAHQGISFHQFIRIVYDTSSFLLPWSEVPLHENQIGFVTPIEISLELEKRQLLSSQSVEEMMKKVAPELLVVQSYTAEGVVPFPYFVDCAEFIWKWDSSLTRFNVLPLLKARIVERCYNRN